MTALCFMYFTLSNKLRLRLGSSNSCFQTTAVNGLVTTVFVLLLVSRIISKKLTLVRILLTIKTLYYVVIAALWNRLTSVAGCVLQSVVRIVLGE